MHINIKFLMILVILLSMGNAKAALNVFSCEPEWKSLLEELGGDRVRVVTATAAFQDPHQIEARPGLIASLRNADFLVCTGAGLEEAWLPLLLRQAGNNKVAKTAPGYFMAAEQLDLLDVPEQLDRSMGDVHAAGNPHVHLDPRRLIKIAALLTQKLVQIDGAHAAFYEQRGQRFQQHWQNAIQQWQQQALPLKGMPVASYHRDWLYLFDWLDVHNLIELEPKPGIPPSFAHLNRVKQIVQQQGVKLIVKTSYQQERAVNWVSRQTGVPWLNLAYTVGGVEGVDSLEQLFNYNIKQLLDKR